MDPETVEVIRRHFNVVAEGPRNDIRALAEGVGANADRLDRLETRLEEFENRVTAEFGETRAMIRLSYGELERRIERLEGRDA